MRCVRCSLFELLYYILRPDTHIILYNPANDSMHNSSQLKYDLRIYNFTLCVRSFRTELIPTTCLYIVQLLV